MKKLCLILALLLHVGLASAQWSVAPEVGLATVRSTGWGESWRPSLKVGAAVEYALKPNFSIESGLYYTQRGNSLAGILMSPEEYAVMERPMLVRHMLQIPVTAKFYWEVADDVRLFIGAGPYVGFYVADKWRNTYYYKDLDYGKTFDWGVSASAGVEIKRWFFRLGYDLALGGFGGGDAINANYHQVTLSVGYKF